MILIPLARGFRLLTTVMTFLEGCFLHLAVCPQLQTSRLKMLSMKTETLHPGQRVHAPLGFEEPAFTLHSRGVPDLASRLRLCLEHGTASDSSMHRGDCPALRKVKKRVRAREDSKSATER